MLFEAFERQVIRNPSHVAIQLEDGRKFTYLELNQVVEQIFDLVYHQVRAAIDKIPSQLNLDKNIVPTPLVAVVMTRDMAVVASILAILKAGAAYVPVDPTFPPDRQSYIFQQSQCLLLITDEKSHRQALQLGVELPPALILHSETAEVVQNNVHTTNNTTMNKNEISSQYTESAFNRVYEHVDIDDIGATQIDPKQQLAYVLYTSGSTGKPKGVMVRQEGVLNIVGWFADEMSIDTSSKVLGLTTLSFDISVLELFMALTRGATLCLAKSKSQKDPFRLLSFISSSGVNVVQATPTTYEMMLATGWTGDENIDFLVSLIVLPYVNMSKPDIDEMNIVYQSSIINHQEFFI